MKSFFTDHAGVCQRCERERRLHAGAQSLLSEL